MDVANEIAASAWSEGIVIPGPDGTMGDGTHEVDLTSYYSADYAIVGIIGMLIVVAFAFVVAARRRLRAHKRKG